MAISNVTGGTTPYGYAWSNLATTPTITGLAAGSYGLTVTDANGCTDQAVFSISETTAISVNATGSDPTCYGVLDGTLSAEVTGGNPTYTYTWFDGTNTYNGSPVLNAGPGTYSLTVTDQNGCNGLDVVTLASPPYFGFSSGTASLGSDHYGQIDIEVSGGAPAYGYQWSNGQTTQDIGGLSSGYYMVTVTDQQGCMIMDTFLVGVPLVIPDAISPNGDGINDDFEIINIQAYSEVSIQVFNRWDQLLFTFEGSGYEYMQTENRWDGTQNGKDLPFGTYLYIIKLNGLDPIAGPVVIVH
jgi:gliding motility-associated-like protein